MMRLDCLKWWTRWTAGLALRANPVATVVAPIARPRRVSDEYFGLYTYLENRYAQTVVLTFEQMEALLGFALPPQARSDPEWWTAAPPDAPLRRHREAWTLAHRTAVPNFPARIVVFERVG
jgi:hypothetical protein